MKRVVLIAAMCAAGCAGTDASVDPGNSGENSGTNNTSANNTSANNTSVNNTSTNNTSANNTSANNTTNNTSTNNTSTNNTSTNNTSTNNTSTNNTSTNNTSTNNSTNNGTPDEWVALVANAELTGDSSSWSVVTFDGSAATSTTSQPFGSGELGVAADGDRAYVVDLATGRAVVLDSTTFQEVKQVDLQITEIDSVAAGNGRLLAASGAEKEIAQYSEAAGGLQPSIPLAAFGSGGGFPMFANDIAVDGDTIAGITTESAQFPTTPKVYVADAPSASIIDVDPNQSGDQGFGVTGASRLSTIGGKKFAIAADTNGIKVLEETGGSWFADRTLMTAAQFGNAEVGGVVMVSDTEGLALTYTDNFEAVVFDSAAGTTTTVDGIALPTFLIGADASADGTLYFVGDYGVRNEPNKPFGVAVVEASTGAVLDHVTTDEGLPPSAVVAVD